MITIDIKSSDIKPTKSKPAMSSRSAGGPARRSAAGSAAAHRLERAALLSIFGAFRCGGRLSCW